MGRFGRRGLATCRAHGGATIRSGLELGEPLDQGEAIVKLARLAQGSPTADFAGLALPHMASGSVQAVSPCAEVPAAGFCTSLFPISLLSRARC
jgi:hypothetical protein